MRVSVVIPTYRRPHDVERCLGGLAEQERLPDEVVVVVRRDDASSRGFIVPARLQELTSVVEVGEPGQVAALHAGAAFTTGDGDDVIALLDDDAVPGPNWTLRLAVLFQDPSVAAAGGRDIVHGRRPAPPMLRTGVITRAGRVIGGHESGVGVARPVHHLRGANMAVRRKAFAVCVGLHGMGAQPFNDMAMSLLSARHGTVVYDPRLVVDHYLGQRPDDDGRGALTAAASAIEGYNRVLIVGGLLPARHALVAVAYSLLVGDRRVPGLLRAGVAAAKGDRLSAQWLPALGGQLAAARALVTGPGRALGVLSLPGGRPDLAAHP